MSAKKKKKKSCSKFYSDENKRVRSKLLPGNYFEIISWSIICRWIIDRKATEKGSLPIYVPCKKERKKKREERRRKNCKLVLSTVERRRKEKGAKRIIGCTERKLSLSRAPPISSPLPLHPLSPWPCFVLSKHSQHREGSEKENRLEWLIREENGRSVFAKVSNVQWKNCIGGRLPPLSTKLITGWIYFGTFCRVGTGGVFALSSSSS